MTEQPGLFAVKPIIKYPREAQFGKTYLMTIDLQPEEGFEWQYEEEEYPIYCSVDSDLFSSKPVGEPVIVLHRFGGSYGEAKFLLTAGMERGRNKIRVLLLNRWGVQIKVFDLEDVQVVDSYIENIKPENYIESFFKECVRSKITRINAEMLKKPMAEAIRFFMKRFIKELQLNDVLETSIQNHYNTVIKQFVRDSTVRPILGKAFEKYCKQIDYKQLQEIWTQQYQVDEWQFPAEEFDWRRVTKEYVLEVQEIVKANVELRSLLETELLEDIARNSAQLSSGFDVETYRHSLQSIYGYLKLYTLDSTDRVDAIKLWAMFIEQTVQEALPPMHYDLPLDLKRQLKAEGQLEADLSLEALEHYRHEYFQHPVCKVLEAVISSQRAVILGDPGSGKSSLLQYLVLEWVEGKIKKLPLLIELRKFALTPTANFLEFLHSSWGADWQFDQKQLHQHLLEYPTLVMFDGLDEVFDRATQSTVIDDIIRFSQQYPNAQILVTSRIIGYNPDRLQQSEFRHFTIQSLGTDEIHEFIDRWYDLSMGSGPDKAPLKQRLKDAIANSRAIANLADNPLLLTMMAILNRQQELPRNRADLYDQASRVLLHHWDVDHKQLQLPMDVIGRREKQEMLRLIAYEMQAGEEGLKGNVISADRLSRILTDYLRDQGFREAPEKANLLIQQLRERNFILCYRGADTYGFVHRTFLNYFCATEIVHRLKKVQSLALSEIIELFELRWKDEDWNEVLRLVIGMFEISISGEIINHLISQVNNHTEPDYTIFIAECLLETTSHSSVRSAAERVLNGLKALPNSSNHEQIQKFITAISIKYNLDGPSFWQPVYRLFQPNEPLTGEKLNDFYIRREDTPTHDLVNLLSISDTTAKFLLAGHRGSGKTTELRRLEQLCKADHTLVWVDTDTALDKFNIGYAEVIVLIVMNIVEQLAQIGYHIPKELEQDLLNSLAKMTYQSQNEAVGALQISKVFQDLGMPLKVGFQSETMKTLQVRPALSEIIERVNAIIAEAEQARSRLLVIVDGLDRIDHRAALEIFSSSLMIAINCHIVYAIPIALRYSAAFRQPMESFDKCFDLTNIPVFKCDSSGRPTAEHDRAGRHILTEVVKKRLNSLSLRDDYGSLFQPDALELLCEKSGGIVRDLLRLVQNACRFALQEKVHQITLSIAQRVLREERSNYVIEDYHFPEMDGVHRTGRLTTNAFESLRHEKIVISEELLKHKLILGYQDQQRGQWFDINPILLEDLESWRSTNLM